MMAKLTLAGVKAELAYIGCVIRKRDGEYRVNFRTGGTEGTAHYTNDLDDALATGFVMVEHRAKAQQPSA